MPTPNIDLTALLAAVEKAKTVQASAVALINNFAANTVAAVTAALQADDAADQGSIDAAVAAINDQAAQLTASSDALGAAVTANTSAAPPTP